MFEDEDIKIFGSQRSENKDKFSDNTDKLTVAAAKELGKEIADSFMKAVLEPFDDDSDTGMLLQRQFLLSFTVTVSLDEYCDDTVAGIAQKQFLDSLRQKSAVVYKNSSDTGAFTFYYLAYRRGSEVDRRIGQTFAMLCSHDGDPVYQEIGEALYCWFASVVRTLAEKKGLFK